MNIPNTNTEQSVADQLREKMLTPQQMAMILNSVLDRFNEFGKCDLAIYQLMHALTFMAREIRPESLVTVLGVVVEMEISTGRAAPEVVEFYGRMKKWGSEKSGPQIAKVMETDFPEG